MSCPVCQSSEVAFIKNFSPYTDMEWVFPVFDCSNCLSRYARRDESINYHNLLHEEQDLNNYQLHYKLADQVKAFITNQNLKGCERLLRKSSAMHGEVIDFIEKHKNKNPRVLELGCSSGYFTAFLNAKGIETYGVDISETAVSRAKNTFPHYKQCFSEIPLHNDYDIIFHKGLLSCVDNPVDFLKSNLTMLRPNGGLIFNMSNVNSVKTAGEIWASTPPPDVVFLFHEKAVQYLIKDLNQYNFSLTKHLNYFLLFKKHLNLFRKKPLNKYPRQFKQGTKQQKTPFAIHLSTTVIAYFTRLLVKMGGIKVIDEDFGIVIKLSKTQ